MGDLQIPDGFAWVANLAVGQEWPKGSESALARLAGAYGAGARELAGLGHGLGAAGGAVLASVGGDIAEEFRGFVGRLESLVPGLADAASQLAELADSTGLKVEYTKAMIILQVILLGLQILHFLFWAPEEIPAAITGARVIIKELLKRLVTSVGIGAALNVSSDVLVQIGQFMAGHRHSWDRDATLQAFESGAVGGAVGGLTFGLAGILKPVFAHSLWGKVILGAVTGGVTEGISYGIWGGDTSAFGSAVTSGFLGALEGGGKFRLGRQGDLANAIHVRIARLRTPGEDTVGLLAAFDGFDDTDDTAGATGTSGAGATSGVSRAGTASTGRGSSRSTGTGTGTGGSTGGTAGGSRSGTAARGRSGTQAGLSPQMAQKNTLGLSTLKDSIVRASTTTANASRSNELNTTRNHTTTATTTRTTTRTATPAPDWPGASLRNRPVTTTQTDYHDTIHTTIPATTHQITAHDGWPGASLETHPVTVTQNDLDTVLHQKPTTPATNTPAPTTGPATTPRTDTNRTTPHPDVRTTSSPQPTTTTTTTTDSTLTDSTDTPAPAHHPTDSHLTSNGGGLPGLTTHLPPTDTPSTPPAPPTPHTPNDPTRDTFIAVTTYNELRGRLSTPHPDPTTLSTTMKAAAATARTTYGNPIADAIEKTAEIIRRHGFAYTRELGNAFTEVARYAEPTLGKRGNTVAAAGRTVEFLLQGHPTHLRGGARRPPDGPDETTPDQSGPSSQTEAGPSSAAAPAAKSDGSRPDSISPPEAPSPSTPDDAPASPRPQTPASEDTDGPAPPSPTRTRTPSPEPNPAPDTRTPSGQETPPRVPIPQDMATPVPGTVNRLVHEWQDRQATSTNPTSSPPTDVPPIDYADLHAGWEERFKGVPSDAYPSPRPGSSQERSGASRPQLPADDPALRESDAAAHEPRDPASHDRPTEPTLSDRQPEPGLPAIEQPRSYEPPPMSFPERRTTPDSARTIPADPHPAPPRVGTDSPVPRHEPPVLDGEPGHGEPGHGEPAPRPEPKADPRTSVSDDGSTAPRPEPKSDPRTSDSDSDSIAPHPQQHDAERNGPLAPAPGGPSGPAVGEHGHPLLTLDRRSLVGAKIIDAPGLEDVRARVLAALPTNVRGHGQVTMALDAALDPATFRARHEQMVNEGWTFPLQVGSTKYEVRLTARPLGWHLSDTATAATDGGAFERAATAKVAAPDKQTLTVSTVASPLFRDLEATVINPSSSASPLGLITVSARVGGYAHLTSTSLKAVSEATATTVFTGPTRRYASTFAYDAVVLGPSGHPIRRRDEHLEPVTAEVTAEIARVDATPTAPVDGGARIRRPLEITGLDHVLDEVFRELPRERSLSGTAHHAIRDFLSPKNVLAHYDQARDGGLVSPALNLSDGRHAWLRLTVTEESTSSQGVIAEKQTHGTRTSSENGTGRLKFHSWKVGASGAVSYNAWQADAPDMESSWPTFSLGYSYSPTRLYEQWVNQGFTLESSVAHAGTSDLLSAGVAFEIEVLRENNSLHADRRITRTFRSIRDTENPPTAFRVLGLRERAPVTHSSVSLRSDLDSLDSRATDAPEDHVLPADTDVSDPPAAPQDPRALLASHRATVVDFPGSRDLEEAIAEEIRRVAPGALPLTGHPNRARQTPLILENERTLRDHLSAPHLLGDIGRLLDRTYSFGLDTPAGRAATVRVWTELGQVRHEGAGRSTAESTITMNVTNQHKLLYERKHEVTGGGSLRRALNPTDTVRFTPAIGVAAAFAPVGVDLADTETQVARGFVHRGTADTFGYQVTHHFSITLHEKGSRPAESGPSTHQGSPVQPKNDARLRVEVRRPDILPAPPSPRFDRLPSMHAITQVFSADDFREQVEGALEHAYTEFGHGGESPDLGEAARALTGETQLRGLISASHSGWVNTLDQHVGTGRNPKAVGVAVRTGPFRDWTFRQTYTDVSQQLKVRSTTSTTAGDQRSHWFNGNISAEASDNPSTPKGELVNSHQERGSGKVRVGRHGESNDMLTHETSTTRTVSHTGTGHLYEATVDVDVVGRVTDPDGTPHIGPAIPHTYRVLVLLSDQDLIRGVADARPDGAPEQRLQAPLLDQGITGGTVVSILDTDPILRDIHRQLGGDPTDPVPVEALPFANAFSAETISARFDDIAGPGIVERFVLTTHRGHVITEVLVRRRADGSSWRSEGHRSDLQMTSESKREEKVTDETKRVLQGAVEGSVRGAVNPGVKNFNSVWAGGTLTPWERSREVGVKAGVGTSVGSRTTGFGDSNYLFTNGINLDVVVTRRLDNGPFLHLPEAPSAGGVIVEASAWVPESLVGTAPPQAYPETPRSADPGPARRLPDVEQGLSAPRPTPEWQTPLQHAHHLVGFDNVNELLTQAVRIQATSRRWGPGFLGQVGHYSSAALNGVARGAWWTVSWPLPRTVIDRAERFLESYSADARLTGNFDALNSEKVLDLREQLALRQTFSAQSLSTLFHRLQNAEPATPYRIPGTSVAVSLHATGSAETVGHRAAAQDEITTAVTGVSSTHTLRSRRWDFTPNLSVLAGNPLFAFPVNTGHFNSEKLSFDPSNPVTLTPGAPSRDTPTTSLPAGLTMSEPGKAKITGADLLRQRVVFTLHHQDDHGVHGAPATVEGHVLYWSAAAAPAGALSDAEHPSPGGTSGSTHHPLPRTATDDSATPPQPTRTVHDSEGRGQDRPAGDADIAEAFRPTTDQDPQPLPPGSKSSGKQPALGELDRSGLRTRVAHARALAADLLTPFSATELTDALRRMEHSEQSTQTAVGDVPVMDRDRAVRLAAEAQAVRSRAQAAADLPSPSAHTSRADDPQPSGDDQPSPSPAAALNHTDATPAAPHGDHTDPAAPHGDHTEPAADPAHERDASILPAPPARALGEIERNETLYAHPAQLPAVRLRGPRWSYQDTRAVHRLTDAQWRELPQATRTAAQKERVQTALDPQTLAETDQLLFRSLARVGRQVIGTPLGSAEVLEQLGRRDPETRGYWDLQDVRDQTLGRAARRALTEYADSRPELREATRAAHVRAALGSGDDGVQAVGQLLESYNGVAIGGNHATTPTWTFLAENMERLQLDTIYLDSVRGDSYQADLDAYLGHHTAPMPGRLDAYVRLHDRNNENNGLRAVLEAARRHDVRVVGVDGRPARTPRRTALAHDRNGADFHRAAMLNTYAAGLIRADQAGRPNHRYVAVVGSTHVGTHPGPDRVLDVFGSTFTPGDAFPGIDNLLGIPGIVQEPAGNLRAHPTATTAEDRNAPDRPAPGDRIDAGPSTADLNRIVYQVETFSLHERLDGLLQETLASEDPSIDQIAALAKARSLASRNVTELRQPDHAAGGQSRSTIDVPRATPDSRAGLSRAESASTAEESARRTEELRDLVNRQLTHWGRADLISGFDDAYAAMPDAHRRRLRSQQADVLARNLVTGTFAGPLPGGAQRSDHARPVLSGSSSTPRPAEIPTTPTAYVQGIQSMLESPRVDVARLLNMLQIRKLMPELDLVHLEEARRELGSELSDRIATLLANRPVVEERVRERIERLISLTAPTSLADLDAAFHGAIQAGGLSRHLDDAVAAGRLSAPDRERISAVLPPPSATATSAGSRTATGDSPGSTDDNLHDTSVYQVRTPSLYHRLDGLLHEAMTGEDPSIEGIAALARARSLAARDVTDVRSRGRAGASATDVHAGGLDGHDIAPLALPADRSASAGPSDRSAGPGVSTEPVRPSPESPGTTVGALRVPADEVRVATDEALHLYHNTADDNLVDALAAEWQLSRDATQRLLTDTSAFLAPFFRGDPAGAIGTDGQNLRSVAHLVTAAAFRRNQLPDTTGLKDKHPATDQRELPDTARGDADARLAEALSEALLGWRDHEDARPLEDLGLDHRHFDRDALRDQGRPGLRGGMPGPSPRLVTQIPLTRFYDSSVRTLLAYGSFRESPEEERSVKAQVTMQNVLQLLRRMRTTHSVNAMRRIWEIPAPNRPALRAEVVTAQGDGLLPSNSDVMADIMHATGIHSALGSQHNPLRNIPTGQSTPRETLVREIVYQIVGRLHRALDHGDAKEFLKQLRPLDRHFDDLRLIEFVWTQSYGTRMPEAAVHAFPDHAGQIRYWTGETALINPDSRWSHPYSGEVINHVYPEEANALLEQLNDATVHYPPLGDIQALSWYPDDGSALRVHAWANELTRRGYAPLKIFAYGGEAGISVERMRNSFDNSRHGYFPSPPPPVGPGGRSEMSPVSWRYHAAIALTVMHESHLKRWVLDPSLSQGSALSVRGWADALQLNSRYDLHALTVPELHRLLTRQYHDYPDSWHRTSALDPASPMRRPDVMDYTLMLMPKHEMIAITEIHAILPPTPDQRYPETLEQANKIAASNYSVLSNQSIVGERRHAAREMIRHIDELNAASWNIILDIIDTTRPEALWGIIEEHPRLQLALLDTFDTNSLEIIYARIRATAPSHIIEDVEFPPWLSQTFGTSEEA